MHRLADSYQRLMELDAIPISFCGVVTKKVFLDHENFRAVPKELREKVIFVYVVKYIAI